MEIVKYVLLCLIGIYGFLSSLYGANFAELNVKFPFLDFPIFIGEFLVFFCLIMLAPYFFRKEKNSIKYLLIIFISFIIIKAILGYLKYGALSLRNAALFYYILFIYIGYVIFSHNFFSNRFLNSTLIIFLIVISFLLKPLYYFIPTYLILILVLILKNKIRFFRYLYIGVIFFSFLGFYNIINRTLYAGIFLAGIFLLISLPFVLQKRARRIFLLISLLTIIGFTVVSYRLCSQIQRFRGFFNLGNFIERHAYYKDILLDYEKRNLLKEEKDIKILDSEILVYDKQMPVTKNKTVKPKKVEPKKDVTAPSGESIFWRVLVWEDMIKEIFQKKPIFGVDFGYPFRSRSLIALGWEHDENIRCGWIEPHNSYLHMVYRAGMVGILIIVYILYLILKMTVIFIKNRNPVGILLVTNILYWFTMGNFIVLLELPYYAIPLWSFFGMALAYCLKK